MKRASAVLIAFAIVVSACGGGDEEGEPAPAPTPEPAPSAGSPATDDPVDVAPQPTIPPPGSDDDLPEEPGVVEELPPESSSPDPGEGENTEFCEFVSGVDDAQQTIGTGLDPAAFQAAMEQSLEGLQRARALAPSEIADDVQYVLDTFIDVIDLFKEYEWNLLAVGANAADDPRLLEFDEAEFEAALDRIGDFCGLELDADDGDTSDPGGTAGSDVPTDVPAALVPPQVVANFDAGGGAFVLSTTLTFEDVVVFYTEVLGDPFFADESQQAALWNTSYEGLPVSVALSAGEGTIDILISVLG